MVVSAHHNLENGRLRFQVVDTGVGIPQELHKAIFEKFIQVDGSSTRPYEGIGLGLYIVKQLTELLGGEVEVESCPGKGSTFTIEIPIADKPRAKLLDLDPHPQQCRVESLYRL